MRTLVEEIERRVKESHGAAPVRIEGAQDATWVLMDYGDFIVHVFLQETRATITTSSTSGQVRHGWRGSATSRTPADSMSDHPGGPRNSSR